MAERIKHDVARVVSPTSRTIGIAKTGAIRQLGFVWTRESLLRLALSIVLAVALWLYVTGKQNPDFIDFAQPIPVTTSFVGLGDTITNTLPNVHVRYKTDNPNAVVTAATFQAEINLLNRRPGFWPRIPVTVVSTNPAVDVVKVSPASLPVVIDSLISQSFPVVPHYLARNLPAGYNAGTPIFTPSTVTVSGPKGIVKQAFQAQIDLNLSGNRSSILALFKPVLVDTQGSPIPNSSRLSISPPDVQVSVPIRAVASFKSLPLLVPLQGLPRTGFGVVGVTVSPSEITATGLPSILSQLTTASTAPVSVAGRQAGTLRRTVTLHLPAGITTSTRRAEVVVQLRPVNAGTSTEIGVRLQNVTPGLIAHLRPTKVLVTVVGPSSSLAKIASSLSAIVDVSGDGIGTYSLTPRVKPPPGFSVEDVYPRKVAVSIQLAPSQ